MLSDITPARLVECRDKLIYHVFTIAVKDWGWMDDNPMLKVRKPKLPSGRVRFLNKKEREALLASCKASHNPYLYTMVVLALSTGARYSEIMYLTWPQVNMAKSIIILDKTKNNTRRVLPIHGHALELLQKLKEIPRLDTDYLFPRADGKAPMEIRKHWEKAIKDASVKNFRFHDLRHTATSYLLEDGATLIQLSEILGHKTLQMVKRYSHLSEQQGSSIVEKMNKRVFGL